MLLIGLITIVAVLVIVTVRRNRWKLQQAGGP
jgi:hypothetical protein